MYECFPLDTGRLHPQTYQFLERVREHYEIEIELMAPDQSALEGLVRKKRIV